ncbi:MAG: DUF99 family protein [Thermoprotei archaeon]
MRIAGVDDGYFPLKYKGGKGKTVLLSAVFENRKLTKVDFDFITVDGTDATNVYKRLAKGEVNLLDGITFAGFNYIDPDETDVVFFSRKPNIEEVERALRKHFNDDRANVILRVMKDLKEIPTPKGAVYVYTLLDESLVKEIVAESQTFSKTPFQLSVASELSKKISRFLLTSLNLL